MILNSLLTDDRLGVIHQLLLQVGGLDGCAVEIGCFRCGLVARVGQVLPHKPVYGFDTFEGLPAKYGDKAEYHQTGEFAFGFNEAKEFVRSQAHNVTLVQGIFPDCLGSVDSLILYDLEQICFAHLDVDLGSATEACLEWLKYRVVPGGVIVIDDYGNDHCARVEPVVNEFLAENITSYRLYRPVPWQAWLRKTS